MTPISIKFPMTKERTGNRRGPRFRRVPDKAGLSGAALCAAALVCCAITSREAHRRELTTPYARWQRVCMRSHALWARVFAGQLRDDDPRLLANEALSRAIVEPHVSRAAA